MNVFYTLILFFALVLFSSPVNGEHSHAAGGGEGRSHKDEPARVDTEEDAEWEIDGFPDDPEDEIGVMSDPLEPLNRVVFTFNDRLYFLVLKPVARGYSRLVPEKARVGVRRFFANVTTPIRFVNSLLQFKIMDAGNELSRFAINTTLGLAGFMDPAMERWEIYPHREDTGQTLGFYGAGPGFYVILPFFGPSSLRDTVGLAGDIFLDPITYILPHDRALAVGLVAYDKGINETSLNIGIYEDMKKDSFDPYLFTRDAYHQHREHMISE